MDDATQKTDPPRRKLSRDARRVQLMDATIEVLAARGYARTTLTEVANQAGLSHGLVNFHFQTKENLLTETLLYLAEEYRQNWVASLEAAGPSPAERLDALMRADFNPDICTPAKLAAWCSFWGEAQSRPIYQERCGSNDQIYNEQLENICAALLGDTGQTGNANRFARVLRLTSEGIWLDMMTMNTPYAQDEGLATLHACAAAFFPKHFNADGLIR